MMVTVRGAAWLAKWLASRLAGVVAFAPVRSRGSFVVAMVAVVAASVSACGPVDDDFAPAGCHQPPDGNWQVSDRQLPNVAGMDVEAAAAAFDQIDLAVSWRYHYATAPFGGGGYSECWCTAPPDGQVEDAHVTDEGWVIVFVFRDGPILGGRPQPADGWGCEEAAAMAMEARAGKA